MEAVQPVVGDAIPIGVPNVTGTLAIKQGVANIVSTHGFSKPPSITYDELSRDALLRLVTRLGGNCRPRDCSPGALGAQATLWGARSAPGLYGARCTFSNLPAMGSSSAAQVSSEKVSALILLPAKVKTYNNMMLLSSSMAAAELSDQIGININLGYKYIVITYEPSQAPPVPSSVNAFQVMMNANLVLPDKCAEPPHSRSSPTSPSLVGCSCSRQRRSPPGEPTLGCASYDGAHLSPLTTRRACREPQVYEGGRRDGADFRACPVQLPR